MRAGRTVDARGTDPRRRRESSRDSGVQPLLLGAVPIKSELLAEIQKNHEPAFDTINLQWREAVQAISRAEQLTILGYGFPPEDQYGRFLFREASARRPAPVLLPVWYYTLPTDRSRIETALREIFGPAVNYEYKGAVS